MSYSCCFVLLTEHEGGKRQRNMAEQMGREMDQILHLCCLTFAVPLGHAIVCVCVCVYDHFQAIEIFYLLNQL